MSVYLKDISVKFNDRFVMQGYSLEIKEGCFNALMGPSGIGKTTVANVLLGTCIPEEGCISGIEDEVVSAVFQEDRLIESYSLLNNMLLVCGKGKLKEVEFLLDAMDLGPHKKKAAGALSGGMKRRGAIARALLYEHSLLILDEPFKGLDEEIKYKVMDIIKTREQNKTVLLITHNEEEADYFGCIKHYMK